MACKIGEKVDAVALRLDKLEKNVLTKIEVENHFEHLKTFVENVKIQIEGKLDEVQTEILSKVYAQIPATASGPAVPQPTVPAPIPPAQNSQQSFPNPTPMQYFIPTRTAAPAPVPPATPLVAAQAPAPVPPPQPQYYFQGPAPAAAPAPASFLASTPLFPTQAPAGTLDLESFKAAMKRKFIESLF